MADPILLIVRKGAQQRFDALRQKTAQLQVKVVWDRRERARRVQEASAPQERRRSDRRTNEPYTWETADFLVSVPERRAK